MRSERLVRLVFTAAGLYDGLLGLAFLFAGAAVYAVAATGVIFARCPRCGHLFHNVLGFHNPLARTCSHCGISLNRGDAG